MKAFFAEPVVRLFLRASLVAGVTFGSKFVVFGPTGVHVTYTSAIVAAALSSAVLAFSEVFTPLNNIVGVFKLTGTKAAPKAETTAAPAPRPKRPTTPKL